MTENSNSLGRIRVSPTVIASIASQSVLKSYGVMGMAARNFVDDIAGSITRDPNHGIVVDVGDNRVTIDVYVIIAYGTRISSVADSIIEAVRFDVERAMDVPVDRVNVHVHGLAMTEAD